MGKSIKEFIEELKPTIVSQIEAKIKALNLDKIDRKWGAFPNTSQEEFDKLTPGQRNANFIKALYHGNIQALTEIAEKSQGTLSGEDGAYFVPPEFSAEVLRVLPNYGVARQLATVIPMTAQILAVNASQSEPAVSWDNETETATTSKMTFGKRTLTIHKLQAINAESNELLADATPAIVEQIIIPAFADALAKEEDNQFFNGGRSGALQGPFVGVLVDSDIITVSMTSSVMNGVRYDDLVDVVSNMYSNHLDGAVWTMHRRTMALLRKIKDTTGVPILVNANSGIPNMLLGYPVVLAERMVDPATGVYAAARTTSPFISFGAYKQAVWIGDRAGMTIDRANQATVQSSAGATLNLFSQDMSALRIKKRLAIAVMKPQLIINLWTGV